MNEKMTSVLANWIVTMEYIQFQVESHTKYGWSYIIGETEATLIIKYKGVRYCLDFYLCENDFYVTNKGQKEYFVRYYEFYTWFKAMMTKLSKK